MRLSFQVTTVLSAANGAGDLESSPGVQIKVSYCSSSPSEPTSGPRGHSDLALVAYQWD